MTTKFLHISSRNRIGGSKSDFAVSIPTDVFDNNSSNVKLNLHELTLNYSWYNVSVENNNNTFRFYSVVDDTEYIITIPTGNYNVTQMKDFLNGILENEYVVTYDVMTNTFRFTASNPLNRLTGADASQFLGVEENDEHIGDFNSTKPVDMTYIDTIYLHSDVSSINTTFDNLSSKKMTQSSILARIPVEVAPFSNINYYSHSNHCEGIKVAGNSIDSMRFFLTDDRGNRLNITSEYNLVLKLQFL